MLLNIIESKLYSSKLYPKFSCYYMQQGISKLVNATYGQISINIVTVPYTESSLISWINLYVHATLKAT